MSKNKNSQYSALMRSMWPPVQEDIPPRAPQDTPRQQGHTTNTVLGSSQDYERENGHCSTNRYLNITYTNNPRHNCLTYKLVLRLRLN